MVAVQRITVVKFGVYYESCDKTGCFGIKVTTDAAEFTNMSVEDLDSAEIWSEKVRCSSKMKPRLRAE